MQLNSYKAWNQKDSRPDNRTDNYRDSIEEAEFPPKFGRGMNLRIGGVRNSFLQVITL